MPKPILIEIRESSAELRKRLKQAASSKIRDRLRALYLIKTGKAQYKSQLAEILSYNRNTIHHWLALYKTKGLEGLLEIGTSTGAPSKLVGKAREALISRLSDPERRFRSYRAVQQYLKEHYMLDLPYKTVYDIVRYQLKAKLK